MNVKKNEVIKQFNGKLSIKITLTFDFFNDNITATVS